MKKQVIIILHLGYWFVYLLLVSFIILAMPHGRESFPWMGRILFASPVGHSALLPAILGFYIFYSILFKKYLASRKLLLLTATAILTSIGCGLVTGLMLSVLFGSKIMFNDGWASFIGITILVSFIALMNGIVGLVMRGFIQWIKDIKLREELNKRNYETELALVKSQISPHFLFNTLNNIDVLIQKDAQAASDYLNKLSEIMRFMLYETHSEKIPLSKELSYIVKYIELQKIRTTNPGYVEYTITGNTESHFIEPLLFIPFIENAFKYADNKRIGNAISISFTIEKNRVHFICRNSYTRNVQLSPDHGGLGNDLIKRRLELLYAKTHKLSIVDSDNTYTIDLILQN